MIINPSASGVTARNRVVIQNAIGAEHDLEVSETHRRGHATRFAQGAAAKGFDVVVSVGGDGTVNEVTNGLAATPMLLGVIPGGSTNVFARQLGFTNDPETATEQLLAGIRQGATRRIGLGKVNGRYFCFHVGMGYDAAVVARVEEFGSLKRWLGHPLFAAASLETWLRRFDRTRPPLSVEVLDGPGGRPSASVDGFFAVALNLDPYSYLGSRAISFAPAAQPDTPLSVVVLSTLKAVPVTRALVRAVRGLPIDTVNGVARVDGVRSLVVRGHRPFPWQIDGDHLGDTDLLDISWEPSALTIVEPR